MKKKYVLNLGAGCVDQDRYKDAWLAVHVDGCYRESIGLTPERVEEEMQRAIRSEDGDSKLYPMQIFCAADLFDFVERYPFKFSHIYAERIFEHMEYAGGEIGRLLEGINRISFDDARLEIVVPNAYSLAQMLINYEQAAPDGVLQVDALNIKLQLNTEFCNVKADPHGSVWTPKLAKEYIESEGTWKIVELKEAIKFAGRDYMKIVCEKPKG